MEPKQSPLFEPVLWEGGRFKILDETLLPWKVDYISVGELSQALQAVKEMKTRAFGQVLTFLYSAASVAKEYRMKDPKPLRERFQQLAEEFTEARPTFDFRGLASFLLEWFREPPSDEEVGAWAEKKIHGFVSSIRKARSERAIRAAELLPDPCRLLTHCNISGELVAVAQSCEAMGKELQVIATETRPYLQGSRLTAWEAARAGVKVAVIPDCAIAQVMAKGEVDAVLVGADRSAQNGDIINKVGTYPLALMAREFGIPFYALVQEPGPLATGEEVRIEERPVAELLTFQGRSLIPDGQERIQGRYPAFDLTPASLISCLVSFEGCHTPEQFRRKYQNRSPAEGKKSREKRKYLLLYGTPKADSYDYLAHALKAEKCDGLLVPEMRPQLWGAQRVTPELIRRDIPTTLISDNMMGTFFAQGEIERLYLFYAGLGAEGPVAISGSLLAALLARAHRVPIELLSSEETPPASLDRDVSTFLGERVISEGIAVHPIEREVVPWALFKEERGDIS